MKSCIVRARRKRDTRRARATAVVEFAVVLPLLMLILFGIIDFGYVFMVRQTMQHAAREGARLAVLQTSVPPYNNVVKRIADIMATTNVADKYKMPPIPDPTPADPEVSVTLTVLYSDVSPTGGFLPIDDFEILANCVMRKEGM